MSTYFEYAAIYETGVLLGSPQKIVIDPLKIELLPSLPREYVVSDFGPHTFAKGNDVVVGRDARLRLSPPKRYLVLTARTAEANPVLARRACEDEVDRGTASVAALLDPTAMGRLIHRGWIGSDRGVMAEGWFRVVEPVRLPNPRLADDLVAIATRLKADADTWRRYTLMARFYAKALPEDPSEEKFLFLWTVLEVFPMKGTSDIQPISDLLARLVSCPAPEVKTKLGIGHLFGMRSNLVHNGSLGLQGHELGPMVNKLEDICLEVIRSLAGLDYRGALDKYLAAQSGGGPANRPATE